MNNTEKHKFIRSQNAGKCGGGERGLRTTMETMKESVNKNVNLSVKDRGYARREVWS
jgi:hypothetical protein